MKKRWSWKMVTALRFGLVLGILGAGAWLIQTEIAQGEQLETQLGRLQEESDRLLQQGREARKFIHEDAPVIGKIESKLQESTPEEIAPFKAFLLNEAEKEGLKLNQFRCEKPTNIPSAKPNSRNEKHTENKTRESSFLEVPFHCQGNGFYGAILRFSDRIYSSKILVSVDRFGISRASIFSSVFQEGRRGGASDRNRDPKDSKKSEDSLNVDLHGFYLEGRIFIPTPPAEENQ